MTPAPTAHGGMTEVSLCWGRVSRGDGWTRNAGWLQIGKGQHLEEITSDLEKLWR